MSTVAKTEHDSSRHWTVDDYMALDEEAHHELIEGALIVPPAPTTRHQHACMSLSSTIYVHVRERDLGHVFAAPFDVVLRDDTVVQPDITFISAECFPELDDGHGIAGAPDLVVEVTSPSSAQRDRIQKRALYRRAGVRWMVLVDPEIQSVEVFELDRDSERFSLDAAGGDDDVVVIGCFPELEISLSELWMDTSHDG